MESLENSRFINSDINLATHNILIRYMSDRLTKIRLWQKDRGTRNYQSSDSRS